MLLLDDRELANRRAAVRGGLAPLYESLKAELEPLLSAPLLVPDEKALLSRAGGRCEQDGMPLEFDPWSPQEHRCASCGRIYSGELHHRAWILPYQLWLAERALQASLFFLLGGDQRHAALARRILLGYAERYERYPNVDNVLGPTRLFFSTYLESIWLLQICIAAGLLQDAGDGATADVVRERIVGPSSAIVASYDEGASNRQVWNNAALLAAASLQDDAATFEARIAGQSGLEAHLTHALLDDGTWYEGENYHLFAARGLWYAVAMLDARGRSLAAPLRERFERAFAAPFLTALPDFTMPSRKDSQYAVSLRQWRIAEFAEIGFARREDPRLAAALARCYEPGHPRRDTGRARSTADVERNVATSALTRADLGWRALLFARPELPALGAAAPRSVMLEGQGYAVFRRDGDVYVGFEFGQSGGGHGHPDRLNLVLAQGETRWLDDMGTGSYVDPSLHWFRSTLAHNAPLIDGRSQPLVSGELLAYDERDGVGWIDAALRIDDVDIRRACIVAPDYLVDELRWSAPRDVRVELPWHVAHAVPADQSPGAERAVLDGGSGLEDGFAFVRDAQRFHVERGTVATGRDERGGRVLVQITHSDRDLECFDAWAPGQPPGTDRRFSVQRAHGATGVIRTVLAWSPQVEGADFDADSVTARFAGGERHRHVRTGRCWRVELLANGARSSIDLEGVRVAPARGTRGPAATHRDPVIVKRGDPPLRVELGEAHYRMSEVRWRDAGEPRAVVTLSTDEGKLLLEARVHAGDAVFAPADAVNPWDNESADTMRAGLQLYARIGDLAGAWMLVPEEHGEDVRVRTIPGWDGLTPPAARWTRVGGGYLVRVELPLPGGGGGAGQTRVDLDLLINETTAARVRRRGQLVLSGARGERVYLRGDRHEASRLIPLLILP